MSNALLAGLLAVLARARRGLGSIFPRSLRKLPTRLTRRVHERVIAHLRPFQRTLCLLLATLTFATATLAVSRLALVVLEHFTAADDGTIALPFDGSMRRVRVEAPRYRRALDAQADLDAFVPPSGLPELDWQERDRRRRAASLLLLEGELDEAKRCFFEGEPSHAALLDVPADAHARMLEELRRRLLEPSATRNAAVTASIDPSPRGGVVSAMVAHFRRGLAQHGEAEHLRFVGELHAGLTNASGASDIYARLLLDNAFPFRSAGHRRFWSGVERSTAVSPTQRSAAVNAAESHRNEGAPR